MLDKNKKLLIILLIACIGMFAFAFALVPLYNVICDAFGVNGKTNTSSVQSSNRINYNRLLTIQFLANNNSKLPWDFYPKTKQITIHPGENKKIFYFAKNNSNRTMTVQAVPSVTPGLAAKHLRKTECFCFRRQTLKAHQSINMPVIFHVDNKLPKNIHELTLSYTLFEVGKHIR